MKAIKVLLAVALFSIAFQMSGYELEQADPCHGPCERDIVECSGGGTKCSGSGSSCGTKTRCNGVAEVE